VDRNGLKATLEVSTNIAVLLVAIAVLSVLAIAVFTRPPAPNLSPGLEKGRVIGQLPNVDYRSSDQTLLIMLNTNCSYCRESLPLYRKIVDAQPQRNQSLRVIAVFPNSEDQVGKYLKENQLTVDSVAGVDFQALRVSGTPTMVLVNNRGEVKDFWTGKLDDREADDFVRTLLTEKGASQ
jgi:hypothetical protein